MKIRLQYVVEDVDRHGNVRIYVRPPGRRKVRLREMPGTDAFMAAYLAAMAGECSTPRVTSRDRTAQGSFSRLCLSYYASAEWKRLDIKTRDARRRYLERIREKRGDLPSALLDEEFVRKLRRALSDKPVVANATLSALKALFAWAVEAGEARTNPAKNVARIRYHSDGYHTWTPEEVRQYEDRHPVGTKARLAMALLLHTAGRREDAVRLGPQHCRMGRVRFTQAKNEHRKPVSVDLPLPQELAAIIAATPTGHLVFLVNQYGKPFSAKGFGHMMRKWCDEAGLPQCSAHGLRKTAATRLAERGATVEEIMAVTGHRSLQQIEIYTRAANRALMADNAFVKLAVPLRRNKDRPTDS
jgi:integrase/recombinase XerD